ncbi:hypothetical protein [Streptomyces sp. GQFP]|uniref:hypothetical protein n=1 Tax=Streptomyces sp. GQFP TaxID=2907545 RepID=UPI001F3105E8|nr:hypothetical protein [Streptomyces sp. GQFP]UIX34690.1 hypothetical protein LUX31_34410 [Streptomyces sp. GQFP]
MLLVPLSLKSIIGGGIEDKRWTSVLDSLRGVPELGRPSNVPFNLTVTYLVPGEVYVPKFSGIRIGSFLADFRSLVVQVALPRHPEKDAREELLDLLDEAIARAEAWGKRKKLLSGPLEEARRAAFELREVRPD